MDVCVSQKRKIWKCNRFVIYPISLPPFFFAGRTVVHAPTTGLNEGSKSITVVAILLPVMPIKYEGKSVKGNVVD